MLEIEKNIKPYKTLVKNFTSLSVLQLTNYLFPLITFPYLVRVLGPEKYGLVNFAAAFTTYFTILTNYGFNLSATQEIAIHRDNKDKVSEIFSSVILAKFFLYLISTIIFLICLILFDFFNSDYKLFIISYLGLIGTILFPLWYFQGIENMKLILVISFISKFLTVIAIFIFIQKKSDYILLVAFYSSSQLLYGILGFITALRKNQIKISFARVKNIFSQLQTGKNYFISSLTISSISNSNVFILGLFADKTMVGYFVAADKIRIAFQSLLGPYFSSAFPYVSNLAKKSLEQFVKFNIKSFFVSFLFGILILLIIYSSADNLINIVLGSGYEKSILILKILSVVPLLYSVSNFFGVQILLPLNFSKQYALIMTITLIVHTIVAIYLASLFSAVGSSIAIIIAEVLMIVLLITFVKKIRL